VNRHTGAIPLQSVQGQGPETTLTEYANICKRRAWLIVACALGCAGAAAVWSFMQTPLYQARATVVIEGEGPGGIERDQGYRQDLSPEYFQTQFELMKSHVVLQRTSQLLHLAEQPEYKTYPSAISIIWESVRPRSETPEMSHEGSEERLLKQFVQNIEITPIRGARLAYVIATSEDPKFAALTANTLVSVYIERDEELNAESKKKAAQWFTTHLNDLRKKVEASQQTLYQYRVKHGLLGGQGRQVLTTQTHSELDTELTRAEMKKAEVQSRFEQIQSVLRNRVDKNGVIEIDWSSLSASAEVLGSPLIQTLRAQDIKASGQFAELADKYGPLHPKLAQAKAELEDLRERIRQEVQKILDSVKQEHATAIGRLRAIKEAAGRHKHEKIRLEQHDVEYGILEREAESSQHLYDMFLRQTKEADLSAGLRSGNVNLADPAVPSQIPVKPQTKANILLGLMLGLLGGIPLAYVLECRDQSLKGPRDLKRYLPSIAVHGVVPLLGKDNAKDHFSLLSENYRIIRTNLMFSTVEQGVSSLLITSPGQGEGKSTLAENLSTAMAQLKDTRVVLIDADLRRPSLHRILCNDDGGMKKGLAHFLQEEAEFDEILHTTKIPNLWVIPCGKIPSNPSELLHSKQMAALLTCCVAKGFRVVVDAPPVLQVADATILATLVDGVLFAVSAGETAREACSVAVERISNAGGKVLGAVIQKVRQNNLSSYYYASQYYDSSPGS
jgi:polysaccharide biosynthesis transport protein